MRGCSYLGVCSSTCHDAVHSDNFAIIREVRPVRLETEHRLLAEGCPENRAPRADVGILPSVDHDCFFSRRQCFTIHSHALIRRCIIKSY
jgi:hypothetical protein